VIPDLDPTYSEKLGKSSGNIPEVLPKRLNVSANKSRLGAKVAFVVSHGEQGEGQELVVILQSSQHGMSPKLWLDSSDSCH
jgi:hypothetical protein